MRVYEIPLWLSYRYRALSRLVVPVVGKIFELGRIPKLRTVFPWTSPEQNSMSFLPINESLEAESTAMPQAVLEEIIDKASHHVLFDKCVCRLSGRCEHHGEDIGCLFMGESALELPTSVTRRVSKDEARAHVRKAIDSGLVPLTGKVRADNTLFQVPDRGKLVTVCFCCHCCCVVRSLRHLPTEHLDEVVVPLEGVSVEVTDDCLGCATCVEYCGYEAISVENGQAVHSELCRQCGRCATHCPNEAVRVAIDNPDLREDLLGRLEKYVEW